MVNNNPELNRSEAEIAAEAEMARKQLEAAEFANAKEKEATELGVKFVPNPSEEKADYVAQIVKPEKKVETNEVHHEAGIPLKTNYSSNAEMVEAVKKLIDMGGSGNDLQEKMSEAWEQYNKAA